MRDYIEIATQADLDNLLSTIAGFHDSMTKELRLINRGFVLPEGPMVMGHRLDGQLLIQSQWPPFAVELLFCDIRGFKLSPAEAYRGAEGSVVEIATPREKREVHMCFDDSLKVHAARLFYAVRPDWLGPEARFRGEVPAPDASAATALHGAWRQCSECCNAWEEDCTVRFSFCPSCRRLTELQTERTKPVETTPQEGGPAEGPRGTAA